MSFSVTVTKTGIPHVDDWHGNVMLDGQQVGIAWTFKGLVYFSLRATNFYEQLSAAAGANDETSGEYLRTLANQEGADA
jgi:hypothetical protein